MKKKLFTSLSVILITVIAFGTFSIMGSATPYAKALKLGYQGSEMQMLCSLAAETGDAGVVGDIGGTSYDEACKNGFTGTIEEWYGLFVKGQSDLSKTVYENACSQSNNPSLNQWLKTISGKNLNKEALTANGEKSSYVYACEYGFDGAPEEWIASLIGKNEESNANAGSGLFFKAATFSSKGSKA